MMPERRGGWGRGTALVGLLLVGLPVVVRGDVPALPSAEYVPDPASVERFGPAYRYPQAGWIVLHIEGEPYERGYQHGRLLAREIADYAKSMATSRGPEAPSQAWRDARTITNAL